MNRNVKSDFDKEARKLERRLREQVDQLERRRIEAEKAEAEAIFEATRYQPLDEHNYVRDGVELTIDRIADHNLEMDARP